MDTPRCFAQNFDFHAHRIFGEHLFRPLRPLDHTIPRVVEQIFQSNVKSLLCRVQTVKVQMVKKAGRAVGGEVAILVHERKSRTGGVFPHAQVLANGLHERGLACAHLAVQGDFEVASEGLK